ncbi:MAG: hypothetical protein UT36_C0002G0095 [Candidatus Peregrinibacteria bacterium GW2011_GWF2_39_17]|nr:MAG: hypothetical protein UT36_C0002G0095 [Candidatus Peregrinibacteria bacterium GW2011_GWF2_39_17]
MFRWLYRHYGLEKIEHLLGDFSKEGLPLKNPRKNLLKKQIMRHIDQVMSQETVEFSSLAKQLGRLNMDVAPSKDFKFKTRESLLTTLGLRLQRLDLGDLWNGVWGRRRYWSAVVAIMVVVIGVFGYTVHFPNQVLAARINTIEQIYGQVFIERDGQQIVAGEGMRIQEGDHILTEGQGMASIGFFDDTQVTIGLQSEVEILHLWVDPANSAYTIIQVEVITGRVWSQIVNLSNGSTFSVSSGKTVFTIDKKATFDVFVSEGKVEARVFDYLIYFEVTQGNVLRKGTLGRPLSITINSVEENLKIEPISDFSLLKQVDFWVQFNLESNQKHLDELAFYYQNEMVQIAGVLPGNVLYPTKRVAEETRLFLASDEVIKRKLLLEFAHIRFSEMVALFAKNDLKLGEKALSDYRVAFLNLARENEADVQMLLQQHKKILQGLPINSLGEVRKMLDEMLVQIVHDEKARGLIQLETTADRLGLALELMQLGGYDLAAKALEDYESQFEAMIDGLGNFDMAQRKELILAILDQKLEDLQYLKLIQAELGNLADEDRPEADSVQQQLIVLQKDTLFQLNALVLNLKERAVLYLSSFLKDVKNDEEIQKQILSRLKKGTQPSVEIMKLINDLEAFYDDNGEKVYTLSEEYL